MALVNTTPTTVKVAETPLTSPLMDKGSITSTWSKWFSAIGTWITKTQENKSGDFTGNGNKIGSFRINRNGNLICINGEISSGTYTNIIVSGITVTPIMDCPVLVSGGTGFITASGELHITATSATKILISATYIAHSKENT